jgi:hypothetical protein
MPVKYGKDRRGTYIAEISFSAPPTPEERAALVAFGAERNAAVLGSKLRQLRQTNRQNAQRGASVRRENLDRTNARLREQVRALRKSHPNLSTRAIAGLILRQHKGTETRPTIDALRKKIARLEQK